MVNRNSEDLLPLRTTLNASPMKPSARQHFCLSGEFDEQVGDHRVLRFRVGVAWRGGQVALRAISGRPSGLRTLSAHPGQTDRLP